MPSKSARQPKRTRPLMPKGYGIAKGSKGMLRWDEVDSKIAHSHNYWICTTRPDGRPHAMPVWAVWVDGGLYFGTDRTSVKARNVAANPAMVVHLEIPKEAIILEGTAEEVTERAALKAVDEAYAKKYKMRLTDAPGDTLFLRLRPQAVLAWTEKQFASSPTRWEFPRK